MKKEIIILTDIWGMADSEWLDQYVGSLGQHYLVRILDAQKLGGIEGAGLSEKSIHEQFVHGGIDRAVQQLLDRSAGVFAVLGFSIGGLIAWKACLQGFQVEHLLAISSTRLRYEKEKPDCNICLIYGSEDQFKPDENWFKNFEIQPVFIEGHGHEVYKNSEIVPNLLALIKSCL